MKVHVLYEKHQSAYRCYHSTETALVKVRNDLLRTIHDCSAVFLVLLELSAAFDTIDHDNILDRLKSNIGLSDKSLSWFCSNLKDSLQCIVIDGVTSEPVNLKYGVPQGYILNQIFFTIYTSQLVRLHENIMLKYIYMLMTLSSLYISRRKFHPPN